MSTLNEKDLWIYQKLQRECDCNTLDSRIHAATCKSVDTTGFWYDIKFWILKKYGQWFN